jgi:hypothetical protein
MDLIRRRPGSASFRSSGRRNVGEDRPVPAFENRFVVRGYTEEPCQIVLLVTGEEDHRDGGVALEGAQLVLLLTEWDEYRRLSPAVAAGLVRRRVILDSRNVLDASAWQAAGWVVRGLGTSREPSPVTQPVVTQPAQTC